MMTTTMIESEHELDPERCWSAVATRDRAQDGAFVYAVRSTGIYCRPSCSSRQPRREQVRFFTIPEAAELAGFRACKRCNPRLATPSDPLAPTIAAACRIIAENIEQPPSLDQLGAQVGLSAQHLQRSFKRLLGISPREYADALRLGTFKRRLRAGESVSEAIYATGYGSSSRLYERSEAQLGMAPTVYRNGGKGMQIGYTIVDSPLGRLLVAATERGVCAVSLGDNDADLEQALHEEYRAATISADTGELAEATAAILAYLQGERPRIDLPLDVQATAFQRQVWQALQAIPYGETRTYLQIAETLGNRKAVRAVGRACATNPVSLIVPCHRALGSDGKLHGFRWGLGRKQALLDMEHHGANQD